MFHDTCQIPSLNVAASDSIPPHTLVRFRGMIQDVLNPEMYMGVYQTQKGNVSDPTLRWSTAKYRDHLAIDSNDVHPLANSHATTVTYERMYVNVIPIPGEAAWVAQAARDEANPPTTHTASTKSKRAADDNDSQYHVHMESASMIDTTEEEAGTTKRVRIEATNPNGAAVASPSTPNGSSALSLDASINTFPVSRGLEVLVCLYDDDMHHVKVGEVGDFIGIMAASNVEMGMEEEGEGEEDWQDDTSRSRRRQQSIRMHALTVRKLTTSFPFIEPYVDATFLTQQKQLVLHTLGQIRSGLLHYLQQVVGGDELVAQLLLCNTLAKV